MLAIQLQNVTKQFGDYTAVNNLNLEVEAGEIYGFLGPNGGGKSTTLRMILGLLKPNTGNIYIAGKNIKTQRSEALQNVGCIIEKPDYYGYLTALQNLKLFARMHGISTKQYNFNALLENVGLYNIETKNVKTFSHGMKQRLGLALALLHNPSTIILDEPNTGLDPQGIIDLRHLLLKLNKEEGKTILLSSHILSEIEEVADSMIVINKGETVAQGKVKNLLNNQELHVLAEVNNAEKAMQILSNSVWQPFISKAEHNTIHFTVADKQIPELNVFFVQHNIEIYNLQKSRSLERYFLNLTQQH
jgi:ABC-type multidrug transport system ATPase subunit